MPYPMVRPTPLRSYSPSDLTPPDGAYLTGEVNDTTRLEEATEQMFTRLAPLLARTADRLGDIYRDTYDAQLAEQPEGAYGMWTDAERAAWEIGSAWTRDLANRSDNAQTASTVAWEIADGVWY